MAAIKYSLATPMPPNVVNSKKDLLTSCNNLYIKQLFARDWEAGPSDWLAGPHGSAGVGKAGSPQGQSYFELFKRQDVNMGINQDNVNC